MGEVERIGAQKRPGRPVVYTRAPAVDRRRYDGRLPMRWLVLTLAAVLVLPAAAGAQVAWSKAYEEGIEAFQKGNDALAEQKFNEAKEHKRAPKQSRKALFSSVDYRPFIPDFYLGVIYARQGHHKQAQEYLERALRDELVKQEDRANYALATSSLQRARDEQTRLASNVRPSPPAPTGNPPATTPPRTQQPPATTTTAAPINPVTPTSSNNTGVAVTPTPVRPPPANTEPEWLAGFRRAMNLSRGSLPRPGSPATRHGDRKRRRLGARSTRRSAPPRRRSSSARARRSGARTPPRRRRRSRRCASCHPGTWRARS